MTSSSPKIAKTLASAAPDKQSGVTSTQIDRHLYHYKFTFFETRQSQEESNDDAYPFARAELVDTAAFDEAMSVRSSKDSIYINFKDIHSTKTDVQQDRRLINNKQMAPYHPALNSDSHASSGRLQNSEFGDALLVESPLDDGPYFLLYTYRKLPEVEDGKAQLEGFFLHDTDNFQSKELWSSSIVRQGREFGWSLRYRMAVTQPAYSLVSSHLEWVLAQAQRIFDTVQKVDDDLSRWTQEKQENPKEVNPRKPLSQLTQDLNNCNHEIRKLNLEGRYKFGQEAVAWMSKLDIVTRSGIVEIWDLRDKLNIIRDLRLDPVQILGRIAEIKAQIAEAAEQHQKQRAQTMEELNTQLTIQNLNLAKETRRDNLVMLEIAKQAGKDSRTMRGIGWVTMSFLPATFVSSFFGMNFFEGLESSANKPPFFKESSKNVWMFFAVAGPFTIISLVWFFFWDRSEAKDQKKRLGKLMSSINDESGSGTLAAALGVGQKN